MKKIFTLVTLMLLALSLVACTSETRVYTVTFDSRNDTVHTTQEVMNGSYAVEPKDPVKDGFIFKYWSLLLDGEPFKFAETKITKNITLYALWETPEEKPQTLLVERMNMVDVVTTEPARRNKSRMSTTSTLNLLGQTNYFQNFDFDTIVIYPGISSISVSVVINDPDYNFITLSYIQINGKKYSQYSEVKVKIDEITGENGDRSGLELTIPQIEVSDPTDGLYTVEVVRYFAKKESTNELSAPMNPEESLLSINLNELDGYHLYSDRETHQAALKTVEKLNNLLSILEYKQLGGVNKQYTMTALDAPANPIEQGISHILTYDLHVLLEEEVIHRTGSEHPHQVDLDLLNDLYGGGPKNGIMRPYYAWADYALINKKIEYNTLTKLSLNLFNKKESLANTEISLGDYELSIIVEQEARANVGYLDYRPNDETQEDHSIRLNQMGYTDHTIFLNQSIVLHDGTLFLNIYDFELLNDLEFYINTESNENMIALRYKGSKEHIIDIAIAEWNIEANLIPYSGTHVIDLKASYQWATQILPS